MRKILLITGMLVIAGIIIAQSDMETKRIKLVSYINSKDGYLLTAIDKNQDSILILIPTSIIYENVNMISIDSIYDVKVKKQINYIDNLTFRFNDSVIWKVGDNPKKIPFFGSSVKGINIKD